MDSNGGKTENNITTHIHGAGNPVSIAAGRTVIQKDITNKSSNINYDELVQSGVDNNQIEELKLIVEEAKKDKSTFAGNIGKWIGKVATSLVAKGLTENLPAITEFVHSHVIL